MDVIFIELEYPRDMLIAVRVKSLKYSNAFVLFEQNDYVSSYYLDEFEKYSEFRQLEKSELPISDHLEFIYEWKDRYEKRFVRAWTYKNNCLA